MANIIGKRITAALAIKGVMQKQLAKHMRVKDNVVSYWCSGSRTPNAKQIAEIAKYLGVSTDYLLGVSIAPTTDKELRYICDYTGLSDRVVRLLHASRGSYIVELLNYFIEYTHEDDIDFLEDYPFVGVNDIESKYLSSCIELANDIKQIQDEIENEEFGEDLEYLKEDFEDEQDFLREAEQEKEEEKMQKEMLLNGNKYFLSKVFNSCLDRFITSQAGADDE